MLAVGLGYCHGNSFQIVNPTFYKVLTKFLHRQRHQCSHIDACRRLHSCHSHAQWLPLPDRSKNMYCSTQQKPSVTDCCYIYTRTGVSPIKMASTSLAQSLCEKGLFTLTT